MYGAGGGSGAPRGDEAARRYRPTATFPASVYPGLDELATTLGTLTMAPAASAAPSDFEPGERSLLHLKANFFASREAWRVMAHQEWVGMTWEFVQQRIAQVQTRTAAVSPFEEYPHALVDVGDPLMQRWLGEMSPADRGRVIFCTVVGSQNQNERSLVTDGEDALFLSNWPSVIPYLDLISLVGQSRWIEEPAELDALLPAQGGFKTRVAHWFRAAF